MTTIPTTAPSEIRAGDTITWRISLPDYRASAGWTLKYRLISSAGKFDITSAASGDDHLVTIAAAVSATYAAGTYQLIAYVEGGTSERYTLSTTTITVLPDLAAATVATDTRSHARKALDAIEAVLEGRAARSDEEYTIDVGGSRRSVKSLPVADLLRLRSYYKNEVRSEEEAEALAQGLGTGRKVWVRF